MSKEVPLNTSTPLFGKNVMITRARAQAGSLVRRIEELGGSVIECATIQIEPPESYAALDAAIATIREYDWLIFTSINGVEQFLARAERLKLAPADVDAIRIAAIGPETASRLKSAGISDCLVPRQYRAEGLLELLAAGSMRGKKVLIPRAAKARDILPETLKEWGAEVNVVEAYRTVAPPVDGSALKKLFREGRVDVITFTSSSTVANFAGFFSGERLADVLDGVTIACIGPITRATVEELGGHADVVALEFTIDGLVCALVEFFARSAGNGVTA
jgi:uroporphyrinogen III methyltransferase / synthase